LIPLLLAGCSVVFETSLSPAPLMPRLHIGRAFRAAIAWQSVAIVSIAPVAAIWAGTQGLLSAILGGGIGVVGILIFALMSGGTAPSAGLAMRVALRAEAAKIVAIVILLWLSFAAYREMVVLAFMSTFIVSVLLAGIASAISGD
jgi:ATP synthase protein I